MGFRKIRHLRYDKKTPLRPRVTGRHFLSLHVAAEKTGNRLGKFIFRFARCRFAVCHNEQHKAQRVSLRDDRRGHRSDKAVLRVGDENAALLLFCAVDAAVFHDLFQPGADAPADEVTPGAACGGNHAVAVGHGDCEPGRFAERVADLGRELIDPAHERIFFKNDLAVPAGVDFKRIALPQPHRAADFLWDHDAAEVVDAAYYMCVCQQT